MSERIPRKRRRKTIAQRFQEGEFPNMPGPASNPSPSSVNAYPEHTNDGSAPPSPPADGEQTQVVVTKFLARKAGEQPRHPDTQQYITRA
jgi:hypothetical protein